MAEGFSGAWHGKLACRYCYEEWLLSDSIDDEEIRPERWLSFRLKKLLPLDYGYLAIYECQNCKREYFGSIISSRQAEILRQERDKKQTTGNTRNQEKRKEYVTLPSIMTC